MFYGLNMIFVPVIWASFDFRPCQKKKLKNIPAKKNLFEKGPWPTKTLKWHGSCHVAVADCATFATWR